MALPAGLTTFTLRFGEPNGYTDSTGALALVGETGYLFPVDPSTDKPVNVTDVVSGQAIIPKRVTVTIGEDGKASVGPLPHTGQASLSPAGFAYRVEWNIPSNKPSPRNRTFVVPSGATADFDLLVPAATVPTVAISQPTVASVNAKTGAVTLTASDVGAATPADLTAGLAGKQNTADLPAAMDAVAADTSSAFSVRQRAALVPRPTGGSNGQALVKNGTAVEWGAAGLTATEIAASATVKAAFAPFVDTVVRSNLQRKREQFLRDNAIAPTVFIDSVNGSDANDGTTPAKAYATLGKLTTAGVVAGARIGLARGSTFTLSGIYNFPALTGTPSATNRTVICAYGTGPMPIITGNIFNITAAGAAGSYIDVQDIKFTNCGTGYALFIFNATTQTDVRIKRCEFGPHAGTGGIIMGVVGGLVEDCYFHDVWNNLEYPSGNGYGLFLTTGTDCTIVRFNTVYNCYKGMAAGNAHRDALFYRNVLIKCRVNCLDMGGGGVVGHPPKLINNFVWHNPTTPNGHAIDTQASSVGPYWRNNIAVSDYAGAAGNVELYCIDSTTYSSVDVDYNLGWMYPGSTCAYGKLGTTNYATLAAFKTALAGTSFAGKEAHSIEADPLIASLAWPNGAYVPGFGSPALNAGVAVGPVSDIYMGTAPDLGAYEVG